MFRDTVRSDGGGSRRSLRAALAACALLLAAPALSAEKAPDSADYRPPDLSAKPFTGDLDGMIKRRQIRVLTAYSKTLYFVDRATQRGLVYDTFKLFEEELNKKLKSKHVQVHVVFVPVARDELIPALKAGRGDLVAANTTITPERLKEVDFTIPTRTKVAEVVVTGPDAPPISSVQDLSGREVYIRKSSSFYQSIETLNAVLRKAGRPPVKVRLAPENLEVEDILEMVNAGLVKITIADNHIAEFWKQVFTRITVYDAVAVREGGEIGMMVRKGSPQLKAALDDLVRLYPQGSARRNQLLQKYLKNTKYAREATSREELAKFERLVQFFRQYGEKYDIDAMLVMAQGYQESGLRQDAKSAVGAIGIMQVMPATGKELAVGDIRQEEVNVHAGVKYMRFMMNQYFEKEPMTTLDKGLFTFAAYNAGPGRMQQLRKEAAKRGLDPNVWFNNVELVVAERVGRETVQYVSNIYKYYLAYRFIEEERAERAKARDAVKQGPGK